MAAVPILILDQHDPERELQFELEYLLSLTTEQRYELMFRRSLDTYERMIRHGHLPPVEIIKRPARKVRRYRGKRDARARIRARNG